MQWLHCLHLLEAWVTQKYSRRSLLFPDRSCKETWLPWPMGVCTMSNAVVVVVVRCRKERVRKIKRRTSAWFAARYIEIGAAVDSR